MGKEPEGSTAVLSPRDATTAVLPPRDATTTRLLDITFKVLAQAAQAGKIKALEDPRIKSIETRARQKATACAEAFFISSDQAQDRNYDAVRNLFEHTFFLKERLHLSSQDYTIIVNIIHLFYGHLVNNQSLQQQLTVQLDAANKIKQQLSFFNERLTLLNSKLKYLNTEQSKAINVEITLLQQQQEPLLSKQQEIYNELITIIKPNIASVCYLATKNKLLNEFLLGAELHSFWEEYFGLTDQLKGFESNEKSNFNYVNQYLMIECDAAIQVLQSKDTASLRAMPLTNELVKKCEEYATQAEDFYLLSKYHLAIRKDLERNFAQEPYTNLLNTAIKTAKVSSNDKSIDTSFLFPHTFEAQQLYGPIALLNEAMNKIAIATAFNNIISNLKAPLEDYTDAETREKITEYQQAASIYARQAMQDVLTAEKLAKLDYYAAATCRALNNSDEKATIFYVFDYVDMHAIQTWQELVMFCAELLHTNYGLTLNAIDFAWLDKNAELAAHQFLPEPPQLVAMRTSQYNLLPSI